MSVGCGGGKVSEPNLFTPQLEVITLHFYHPIQFNASFLREQYLNKKLSAREIAKTAGCSKSTVLKALKNCGIPLRTRQELIQESLAGAFSPPPYGKKLIHGKLVDHEGERNVIDLIKDLGLAKQNTHSQIAHFLNHKGIPTKSRKALWYPFIIKEILKRETQNLFNHEQKEGQDERIDSKACD